MSNFYFTYSHVNIQCAQRYVFSISPRNTFYPQHLSIDEFPFLVFVAFCRSLSFLAKSLGKWTKYTHTCDMLKQFWMRSELRLNIKSWKNILKCEAQNTWCEILSKQHVIWTCQHVLLTHLKYKIMFYVKMKKSYFNAECLSN